MSPVTAHRTANGQPLRTASEPTWAPVVACRSPTAIGRSSTCWYVVLICSAAGSFDRHRLRQVARAVDVEAAQQGDPVGEELEGQHRDDCLGVRVGAGRRSCRRRGAGSPRCIRTRSRSPARACGPPGCSRGPSRRRANGLPRRSRARSRRGGRLAVLHLPAEYASVGVYEISLSFRAPSRQTGRPRWRPR